MRLVLFSINYPFGANSVFLEKEVPFLTDKFSRVTVVPLFGSGSVRDTPGKVDVLPPVFKSRASITQFLALLSPQLLRVVACGLSEGWKGLQGLVRLCKLAVMITGLQNYLQQRPELFDAPLWYFYWGTGPVNVLPFLDEHPPAVARFHGYDLYEEDVRAGMVQYFVDQTLSHLHIAIPISQHGFDYLKKKYPWHTTKLNLCRLGVRPAPMNPEPASTPHLVSCSSVVDVKRVTLIPAALQHLKGLAIEWTHFGDGPEMNQLSKACETLPDNIKTNLVGHVSNAAILDFYTTRPVSLFLNVSASEGIPFSIMEAMSFGIPILATDVGGINEIVSEDVGALLPANVNPSTLSDAIRNLLTQDLLQLRANARVVYDNKLRADRNFEHLNSLLKSAAEDS
jgi:glycosyltransferase involved in cell wall biosynthesis